MSVTPLSPGLVVGLAVFLVLLGVQRVGELVLSARNVARLKALGAREYGAGHFPLIVLVHVLFPLGLIAEVVGLGARPWPLWPLWLVPLLAAQVLRYSAVLALDFHWTVSVWVVPGLPPLRSGPYRRMRHPNYLAVVIELLVTPLMFGAWRTAVVVSALDLLALAIRIRVEERALREASGGAR